MAASVYNYYLFWQWVVFNRLRYYLYCLLIDPLHCKEQFLSRVVDSGDTDEASEANDELVECPIPTTFPSFIWMRLSLYLSTIVAPFSFKWNRAGQINDNIVPIIQGSCDKMFIDVPKPVIFPMRPINSMRYGTESATQRVKSTSTILSKRAHSRSEPSFE